MSKRSIHNIDNVIKPRFKMFYRNITLDNLKDLLNQKSFTSKCKNCEEFKYFIRKIENKSDDNCCYTSMTSHIGHNKESRYISVSSQSNKLDKWIIQDLFDVKKIYEEKKEENYNKFIKKKYTIRAEIKIPICNLNIINKINPKIYKEKVNVIQLLDKEGLFTDSLDKKGTTYGYAKGSEEWLILDKLPYEYITNIIFYFPKEYYCKFDLRNEVIKYIYHILKINGGIEKNYNIWKVASRRLKEINYIYKDKNKNGKTYKFKLCSVRFDIKKFLQDGDDCKNDLECFSCYCNSMKKCEDKLSKKNGTEAKENNKKVKKANITKENITQMKRKKADDFMNELLYKK